MGGPYGNLNCGWYGVPYGNWYAKFVAFCLHCAGIPGEVFGREMPTNSDGDFDLTLFTCTYGGESRVTIYCDKA